MGHDTLGSEVIIMQEVPINFVAILLSGVAMMVVGFLWYSPMLFGKAWMKLSGLSMSDMKGAKKEMPKIYGISFVASLLTAYVLRHSAVQGAAFYNMTGVAPHLMAAFWSWLGFVMPVQLTGWLFEKKPLNLFAINTGYQLVSMLVMGVILGMF